MRQAINRSPPEDSDWNQFWAEEKTKKFTQISWSKKRIQQVLSPYVGPGKKALDAGCGSGFFSRYFCDQGMKTVALDYSESALKIASRLTGGLATIVKKDLLREHLAKDMEGGFDLIFSDGLLEHFSSADQDKILKNLLSLLSDQGVLVTFVPNRWSPWELIRPLYMPGIEETPFVLKELLVLNQRNGLQVVDKGGVNTWPFAFSPDCILGAFWGMLLYTIARKNARPTH